MRTFPHLIVLTYLGAAGQYPHYPTQSDCPYKVCFCEGSDMVCADLHLKAVPQIRNTSLNFGTLNLDGNQITAIPAGSLPANLSTLSLQGNPIETIDIAAFDESINTLRTLLIFGARFTHLPAAIFRLKQLTELGIYATNILAWDYAGMRSLGATLQSLNLGNVVLALPP